MSSSDKKSVNSKLVSNLVPAKNTELVVNMTTTSSIRAVFLCCILVATLANLEISIDFLFFTPVVFSTTTCNAPTVTVLAINAQTTPNANVIPKVCSGGKGDSELAKNADTVVTTASVNATLIIENDLIHA